MATEGIDTRLVYGQMFAELESTGLRGAGDIRHVRRCGAASGRPQQQLGLL